MKLFTLCLLVGFAAATTNKWQWESQKEYRFQYSGRMLTGIPELSTQHSGVGINCTVALQVKTPSMIYMTIEEPKFVGINGELEKVEGNSENLKKLLLPKMQPVPEEQAQILRQPIVFSFSETGDVNEIVVSKEEPEWSVNFKKALVALFRVKFVSSSSQMGIDNMIGSEFNDHWSVEEESLFGRCEASYQVNQLPEWFVTENPELVPYPEACPERKYFEVVRTFDMDKCNKLSSFNYFKLGRMNCNSETMTNCGDTTISTSSTRFIACGSRQQGLTVQSIVNDAGFRALITGYKSEWMVSGTYQLLRLKEVRPVSSHLPEPSQPIKLDSLMYEYGKEWYGQREEMEGRIPKSQLSERSISKVSPRSFLLGERLLSKSEVEQQIKTMLFEAAKEIHTAEKSSSEPQKVNNKLLSIARGFTMLEGSNDIAELFGKIESHTEEGKTARQFFIDAAVMSGTPQAIRFLKSLIEEQKLSHSEAVHFFMWLPHTVLTPSRQVLNELFELVTSHTIKNNPTVYSAAITGFSQLVQSACVSESRINSYPTWVFGEFCNPESEIVQSKLIPYLAREITEAGQPDREIRNVHIIALGMIRHKNVIPELTSVVEGSTTTTTKSASLERVLATASLASAGGNSNPSLVVPVLLSIFTNPSESTDVRIVAFNGLLALNPPAHVFQTIAAATRQEPTMDYELLKTVNIALYTLGHDKTCSLHDLDLSEKARSAYSTVKKTYGIVPSSGTWYKTELLKEMGMGYTSVVGWIASQQSVLPKATFAKINYFFGKFHRQALGLAAFSTGFQSVYESLNVEEQITKGLGDQWKEVIQKLRLESENLGTTTNPEAIAVLSVLDGGYLVKSFGERTAETIREKMSSMMMARSSDEHTTTTVNVQKTVDMATAEALIPSDMGFPIVLEVHAPVTASLVGKMSLTADKAVPSASVSGKVLVATQFSGSFGTVLPFTEEYLVTGIDHTSVVNVPGTVTVNLNLPEQKASISVNTSPAATSGPLDVFYYEALPFTVRDKVANLRPFLESGNLKPIKKCGAEYKHASYRFGETLGLSFKVATHTESSYTGFSSFVDTLRMYNYNPLYMIMFGNTSPALSERSTPSVRRHKYAVTFNPTESSTKEIAMELKFGYASKKTVDEPVKYHSIKVVSESERESSSSSSGSLLASILPYQVRSEHISSSSSSVHPVRVEKIMNSINNLEATTASGFTVLYNLILKGGSRPRTFSYALTASVGSKHHESSSKIQQKWDIKIESEQGQGLTKNICVAGNLDMPVLPMWNIDNLRTSLVHFQFFNKIGMGSNSCEESKIIVRGNAKTSHRQKTFSRESPEAEKCNMLSQMGVMGSNLSPVCETVRLQATTLDEVDFKTEFINVPKEISMIEREAIVALRGYLWPYYSFGKSSSGSSSSPSSHQTLTRIVFKQNKPSFDLTVDGPNGHVVFNNVHINHPYSLFFPMKASTNNAVFAIQKVYGVEVVTPTCVVDSKSVTMFDNKTMSFLPGKCFHLLTSDCSKHHRFGVTVRSSPSHGNKKEVKLMILKTVIKMLPTSSSQGPKVEVDGKEMEVPKGKTVQVKVFGQSTLTVTITRTIDGVIVVKAPSVMLDELKTNCEHITVTPSPMLKNKMCGVCGNPNSQMASHISSGPLKCVHSRPELIVASYRIQSESCPSLPDNIKSELIKENEKCASRHIQPTLVASSYKADTGKCMFLRHVINQRPGQICISKVPITQCGPSCKSKSSDMVEKSVSFTCLPSGRLADHYVMKAQSGETLEELKSMETSFSTSITQPRHCVHALVGRY